MPFICIKISIKSFSSYRQSRAGCSVQIDSAGESAIVAFFALTQLCPFVRYTTAPDFGFINETVARPISFIAPIYLNYAKECSEFLVFYTVSLPSIQPTIRYHVILARSSALSLTRHAFLTNSPSRSVSRRVNLPRGNVELSHTFSASAAAGRLSEQQDQNPLSYVYVNCDSDDSLPIRMSLRHPLL